MFTFFLHKKRFAVSLMLLTCFFLLACSSQKSEDKKGSSTSSSTISQTSSTQTSSNSSSQPSQNQSIWTDQKAAELETYLLKDWGPRMGQVYKSYQPGQDLNYYGVIVPTSLLNPEKNPAVFSNMTPSFSGTTLYLVWSKDGRAEDGLTALVAVYADTETVGDNPNSHLYLFTIDKGQGEVWVTEQNQGNEENTIYFKETENAELRQFFMTLIEK